MEGNPAIWPLPKACESTAKQLLIKLERDRVRRAKKKNPTKKLKDRDPVADFKSNQFRKKFYQIVSHHCVMILRDHSNNPKTDSAYGSFDFARVLGINHTQVKRWQEESTFIEADSFFAFLVLVERSFDTLRKLVKKSEVEKPAILDNESILEESTYSMLRFLSREFDGDGESPKELVRSEFKLVYSLMSRMREDKQAVYVPTNPDATKDSALSQLTDFVLDERRRQFGNVTQKEFDAMKRKIKQLLNNWTLAYSLFALGYQPKWPQMKGIK